MKAKLYLISVTLLILNCIFNYYEMYAKTYPTKLYKWEKLADINSILDTSSILYSKIEKSSSGKIFFGGRGYLTQKERPIYQSTLLGNTWEIAYTKDSQNMDFILDSQDNLIVFGKSKDSANYVIFNNLINMLVDTLTFISDRKETFTRILEYKDNLYLIKSNDGSINYLYLLNRTDKSLTKLLPRTGSNDSLNLAIDKDLRFFADFSKSSINGRIILSTFFNLYYTDDLFKTLKLGFYDSLQFNIYKHIILNDGKILYSHFVWDSIENISLIGLFGFDENLLSRKEYLVHEIKKIGKFGITNPISMMACSNGDYIVCKLGGTSYNSGFGDTLNTDSLVISRDNGNTFSYVPFPEVDATYNYFAYASPSVTKDGEIFLAVQRKKDEGEGITSFKASIYYGVPDDVGVDEKINSFGNIYPNPVSDFAWYKLEDDFSGIIAISILDILGHATQIYSGEVSGGVPLNLDFSTFPTGFYSLIIDYGTKREVVKVIKN